MKRKKLIKIIIFQEVYSAVLLDHAEIFWLDSYDNIQVDSLMN